MRLIDADAVLKDLDDLKKSPWYHFDNPFVRQGMRECMEVVEEACIKDAPTVDAEPVRHGKWMPREEGVVYPFWERYTCSACGKHADNTEYCPHCGARMVEE